MMEEKTEQELIQIIEIMGDYDEVADALIELKHRKNDKVFSMLNKIIREQLGDVYLQAMAFELLYQINFEEALTLLNEKINEFDPYILASAMDCLSEDSEVIDIKLVEDIVKKLLQRSKSRELDDTHLGQVVREAIDWFKESYGPKLQKS